MNDQIHASVADVLDDEHLVMPTRDSSALETYLTIRTANPWLPDPSKIPMESSLELTWGGNSFATLTMTVRVDLPNAILIEEPS